MQRFSNLTCVLRSRASKITHDKLIAGFLFLLRPRLSGCRTKVLLSLSMLGLLSADPLFAQGNIESKIKHLEEQVELLKQQIQQLKQDAVADSKPDVADDDAASLQSTKAKKRDERKSVKVGWTNHPFIRTADRAFEVRFFGKIQTDFRASPRTANAPLNTFLVRRARLGMRGVLWRNFEYDIETSLIGNRALLRNAFINVNYLPQLQFQVGQFKSPFSLERLTVSTRLDFIERALVASIAPGRDVGFMFHGNLINDVVEYQAALFNGDGIASRNRSGELTKAGRVVLAPFSQTEIGLLEGLRLGGSITTGRVREGRNSFVGHTADDFRFFRRLFVMGTRNRTGFETSWSGGPFSIKGEFIRGTDQRLGQGRRGEDLPSLIAKGWYVSGTWLVTGEKKSRRIIPRRNFLDEGGFGAVELALRYEQLRFLGAGSVGGRPSHNRQAANIIGNSDRALTVGINWWLNRFVRYQSNFVFEKFDDPVRAPDPNRLGFFTYLTRFQLVF